jgi:hypothetical protein
MSLQSCKLIIWKFLGLPLGSLKNFNHFDVAFVTNHKLYYREENNVSSQGCGSCESNQFGLPMIKS